MDSVQSRASSSSSGWTSKFTSQTELEMESSKARHWSHLDYSTTDSEGLGKTAEVNFKYFDLLKEDPQWGRFFRCFEALKVGKQIGWGAQADIYEARLTYDGPFDLVVKVMKGDSPLQAFQSQWPIGLLSARSKYKHLTDLPLITILGATVLNNWPFWGRFAFVMYRRWGDLRLLIDRLMKQERSTLGPFAIDQAIQLMLSISEDMAALHTKHDILHRDLKASNVLVWGDFGEDVGLLVTLEQDVKIETLVADFECSVGVIGTGFWRAPEILEQLRDRVGSSKVKLTQASDVYSFGMTCYEIVTGRDPFDDLLEEDIPFREMVSQVLDGRRPDLPLELPVSVRTIIVGCWHPNPWERSTFSAICMALKLKRCPNPVNIVIDNGSMRDATIVKVEQWINPQPLSLLKVMERLVSLDLRVSMACDSSSTEMITQYFEVVDENGMKVVDGETLANIRKVLSLPIAMKWMSESGGTPRYGNSMMQVLAVEVITLGFDVLGKIFDVLVGMNIQVHLARCWIREGEMDCVIHMEGATMDSLFLKLGYLFSSTHVKVNAEKVVVEDYSNLTRHLQNLQLVWREHPSISSNIHVHRGVDSWKRLHLIGGIVYCNSPEGLVVLLHMLRSMKMNFHTTMSQATRIDNQYIIGTLIHRNMEKIRKILDVGVDRDCCTVDVQLVVKASSKKLYVGELEEIYERFYNDLMKSLCENGLSIIKGQVCNYSMENLGTYQHLFDKYQHVFDTNLWLLFFVTEN